MKLNTAQQILDLAGKPIAIAGLPLTLKSVAVDALLATGAFDAGISGMEKVRRNNLAERIYRETVVDLSVDDAKLLKDRIGLLFGPRIVAETWRMLEGEKPGKKVG